MAAATSVTFPRRNRSLSVQRSGARLRVDCLSDDEDAKDNRVVAQVPKPSLSLNAARRPFIEVFAGSCRLTQAFSKLGYQTFPIDVKNNTQHDLASGIHLVMEKVWKVEVETGLKPYIHFAPPCATKPQYQRIRSLDCTDGLFASQLIAQERNVLECARMITHHTLHVIRELSRKGYPVTLEQPSGSPMFKLKVFKIWVSESGAVPTIVDYCQFGTVNRNRTCLWSCPGASLKGLARKCPGKHKHRGTGSTYRACSGKPLQLCDEWARLFSLHCF